MNDIFLNIFFENKLPLGRLISWSKSGYKERHPDNKVIFNANIFTEKYGKVWYGDIDFTIDKQILQKVANKLKMNLYILYEYDGRFENENIPFNIVKEKAIEIVEHKVA